MPLWILYFSLTTAVYFLGLRVQNYSLDYYGECDVDRKRGSSSYVIILLVFVLLAFFSSFRSIDASAIDEWVYRRRATSYSFLSFQEAIITSKPEYLMGIITWIGTRLINNTQSIFIVFSIPTVYFYISSLSKHCREFAFSILLYMVAGIYYTMFNITQQALACALFALCAPLLIIDRKFKKYVILVLICSLIHSSSIILLPLFFLTNKKPNFAKAFLLIGVTVAIINVVYRFVPVLSSYFSILESYISVSESGHAGVRYVTVLINLVPALLCFAAMNQIPDNDSISIVSANLTFIHAGIYLGSLLDRYIARLAMFTDMFVIIFLARCWGLVFRNNSSVTKVIAIILYSVVLFLRFRYDVYTLSF